MKKKSHKSHKKSDDSVTALFTQQISACLLTRSHGVVRAERKDRDRFERFLAGYTKHAADVSVAVAECAEDAAAEDVRALFGSGASDRIKVSLLGGLRASKSMRAVFVFGVQELAEETLEELFGCLEKEKDQSVFLVCEKDRMELPRCVLDMALLCADFGGVSDAAPGEWCVSGEMGACREVFVHVDVEKYARDIVFGVRCHEAVVHSPSPRTVQCLLDAVRALAVLERRMYGVPSAVFVLAHSVIDHRIHVKDDADMSPSGITDAVLKSLSAPV